MKLGKQQQRVLDLLKQFPEGISCRRLKHEFGLTEANGRISELRINFGFDIRPIGRDGRFDIQKLFSSPTKKITRWDVVFREGRPVRVPVEVEVPA